MKRVILFRNGTEVDGKVCEVLCVVLRVNLVCKSWLLVHLTNMY